jgi:hypothetical protein
MKPLVGKAWNRNKKKHSLHHTAKLGKMPIRVVNLVFDLCVVYYRSTCTQISLITEKTSKEENLSFVSGVSLAIASKMCNVHISD